MKNQNFLKSIIIFIAVILVVIFFVKSDILPYDNNKSVVSDAIVKCPSDDADWSTFFTPEENQKGLIDKDGLTVECPIDDTHTLVYEMIQSYTESGKMSAEYNLTLKYDDQQLYLGSSSLYNPGGVAQFIVSRESKDILRIYTISGDLGGVSESGWFVNTRKFEFVSYDTANRARVSIDTQSGISHTIDYAVDNVSSNRYPHPKEFGEDLVIRGIQLDDKVVVSFEEPIRVTIDPSVEIFPYQYPALALQAISSSFDQVTISVGSDSQYSFSLLE